MIFFKPKQPPPPPLTKSSSPPFHVLLQQAYTSLQTNVSNFLQNTLPQPPYTPHSSYESPAWARVSNYDGSLNGIASAPSANLSGGRSSGGTSAMSTATIEERFTGVPVYALSNSNQEFVLVSAGKSKVSLGLFCFGEADATALLHQMECMDPSMHNDYRVVPVSLNEVIQLKVNGMAFRLIPEVSQVNNAIKERRRTGISDTTFPGVPVFQSKSLVLRKDNTRYRPFFFRKEDLEKSLSRASKELNLLNPALKGDIQVAVLEDIIQGMKDDSTSTWNDAVFIPPGFDVSIDPPRR